MIHRGTVEGTHESALFVDKRFQEAMIMSSTATMLVSTAEEMNPSRRSTMEDCHVTLAPGSWNCPDPDMGYVGVYDGHGGTKY